MELRELIDRSGDSQFLEHEYEDGVLVFSLEMTEFGARVDFRVETDECTVVEIPHGNEAMRTCWLELAELEDCWEFKVQGTVALLTCLVDDPGRIAWESGSE